MAFLEHLQVSKSNAFVKVLEDFNIDESLSRNSAHLLATTFMCTFLVKLTKLATQHTPRKDCEQFRVGIIGSGAKGTIISQALSLSGEAVIVSTRRPEAQVTDISYCFDNHKAASCSVLILACLPSQLEVVAQDLRGCVPGTTVVISLLSGVSNVKVKARLECCLVLSCDIAEELIYSRVAPLGGKPIKVLQSLNDRDLLLAASPFKMDMPGLCSWMAELVDVLYHVTCKSCDNPLRKLNQVLFQGSTVLRQDDLQRDDKTALNMHLEGTLKLWLADMDNLYLSLLTFR